jgi:hypothetical protein
VTIGLDEDDEIGDVDEDGKDDMEELGPEVVATVSICFSVCRFKVADELTRGDFDC